MDTDYSNYYEDFDKPLPGEEVKEEKPKRDGTPRNCPKCKQKQLYEFLVLKGMKITNVLQCDNCGYQYTEPMGGTVLSH